MMSAHFITFSLFLDLNAIFDHKEEKRFRMGLKLFIVWANKSS